MQENTVYDKVCKTVLYDRPRLAIPLVNEVFQEQYKGRERLEFLEGTHYIKDTDGKLVERTTDSYFKILDEREKDYHFEVQSTPDTTMVQRVYEYDGAVAYKNRTVDKKNLTVTFPCSAVLFLRHTKNTPDVFKMTVKMSDGTAVQLVPVIKLGNYTLDDIFEKDLLILIPFHIFVYENSFKVYDKDATKLEQLKNVFRRIMANLNMLVENGKLDAYDRHFLVSMTVKVVENLAEKFENVVKGVKEVMIGIGIDYPGREAYYKGREDGMADGMADGRKIGRTEGALMICIGMIKDGIITLAEAAKRLDMPEEKVKSYLK